MTYRGAVYVWTPRGYLLPQQARWDDDILALDADPMESAPLTFWWGEVT